jgi:UDP-N-acetylglucosamine:LPS N-acetylglucosamine transferase
VNAGAGILVKDANVSVELTETIVSMIRDKEKLHATGAAASKLFTADADLLIAREIINTVMQP